ncbi:hypothetical protein MLD38_008126 [Melastoma candidum]|uniref:Uncharacterized protein n=1 Tax=Melastoma candidum TaxID=119954 RepID=A0ACB9RSR7_9MYRT|nr:hypothetical protein MLD38_008126 [Melastoma candidum]
MWLGYLQGDDPNDEPLLVHLGGYHSGRIAAIPQSEDPNLEEAEEQPCPKCSGNEDSGMRNSQPGRRKSLCEALGHKGINCAKLTNLHLDYVRAVLL